MKKLLILSSSQFGYLTDTLKYCQHCAHEYDITYVGWDYGERKIEVPGVNVHYISRKSNLIIRNLRLLNAFNKEIKKGYHAVFANYKAGISLVKLLNAREKFVLDIRTLSVNPSKMVRYINDLSLKTEMRIFSEISVISHGVAEKLKLKKYHYLPLGGEKLTSLPKKFDNLSFLYVGTLFNRNIIDCVKGFKLFLDRFNQIEQAPTFTIVGDSAGDDLGEISNYIKTHNLQKHIIVIGAVPYSELNTYFDNANIGICYIPMKSYYDCQPSTKTYEYLISGLPVVATATLENKKALIQGAGVLIQDNSEAFADGLDSIYKEKDRFDSVFLTNTYAAFNWERIVSEKFRPIIDCVVNSD